MPTTKNRRTRTQRNATRKLPTTVGRHLACAWLLENRAAIEDGTLRLSSRNSPAPSFDGHQYSHQGLLTLARSLGIKVPNRARTAKPEVQRIRAILETNKDDLKARKTTIKVLAITNGVSYYGLRTQARRLKIYIPRGRRPGTYSAPTKMVSVDTLDRLAADIAELRDRVKTLEGAILAL